jgi:putative membrane protein
LVLTEFKQNTKQSMKTHKWIFAILIASLAWTACDEDEDNPIDKPELPDADEVFVEFAARSNRGEVVFGELAATKATDSTVKAFAQSMVNEHNIAQDELKEIADDHDDIDWPERRTAEQDSIMNLLESASGHSFDTLYASTQVKLHQGAADNFRAAATNATNARVKAYANKYLPKIEMHLQRADSIYTALATQHAAFDEGADSGDDTIGGDGETTN